MLSRQAVTPNVAAAFAAPPASRTSGAAAPGAVDHHIGECDARAEARAERLERRLLGSKPTCKTLDPVGPIADLVEFGLDEAPRNQRVARILNPALHLGDVHQVNTVSDDVHKKHLSLSPIYI
jgi:hypothetical protein